MERGLALDRICGTRFRIVEMTAPGYVNTVASTLFLFSSIPTPRVSDVPITYRSSCAGVFLGGYERFVISCVGVFLDGDGRFVTSAYDPRLVDVVLRPPIT